MRTTDIEAPPLTPVFESVTNMRELKISDIKVDVVMSNPPFFSDVSDAVSADSTRSLVRPPAKSISSGTTNECQTAGGEVGFFKRLAEESLQYKDAVG